MPRRVRDVMTGGPVSVSLDAPLAEVARLMRDRGIGGVLVTNQGRLCGMVTDRDIVIRAIADGRDPARISVGAVCSADIATLAPDDDAGTAVKLMRGQAVRRVPVVRDGRPVGIVSIGDLAIALDDGSVLADISKAPPNV